jgi:hypothetical protein
LENEGKSKRAGSETTMVLDFGEALAQHDAWHRGTCYYLTHVPARLSILHIQLALCLLLFEENSEIPTIPR